MLQRLIDEELSDGGVQVTRGAPDGQRGRRYYVTRTYREDGPPDTFMNLSKRDAFSLAADLIKADVLELYS